MLDRYKLIRLPMDVYQISHVPFTLEPLDVVVVVVSAIVICFAATIYPSRQAARLDPAQALQILVMRFIEVREPVEVVPAFRAAR